MATIKDIATKTGLSVGTVSRVMNNRGYISEETRDKVTEAMKSLNYKPNELARSLTKKNTNMLGIIMPHIEHPYFSRLISRLERAASKYGYKILLCNTRENFEREKDYIDMCLSNRVSGIIICSSSVRELELATTGIPVVVMEKWRLEGVFSVDCDNYQGGKLATEHLIQCQCKNLLYLGNIINVSMPADDRSNAFWDTVKRYNVQANEVQCTQDNYNSMEYREFIQDALEKYPDTDGIFTSGDLIAAQALQVCAQLGKRVPKDIKIVGFDDSLIATQTCPQITTIRQPLKEMAEAAVRIIVQINRGEIAPLHITLPVSLIERGSC